MYPSIYPQELFIGVSPLSMNMFEKVSDEITPSLLTATPSAITNEPASVATQSPVILIVFSSIFLISVKFYFHI